VDSLLSVKTIGRYRVERLLGAGGFGVVWLARDTILDSPVAIKVMAENAAARLDLRGRFLAEAQLLRQVGSPRVVQIYDIGELPDARPYFVMEHANKGTLAELLARGSLPTSRALRLAAQVAYAVGALHERGVLHRDIKPSNVRRQRRRELTKWTTPDRVQQPLSDRKASGHLDPEAAGKRRTPATNMAAFETAARRGDATCDGSGGHVTSGSASRTKPGG
jgi:hypothetical protein